MRDFNLAELIEQYLVSESPTIYSPKRKSLVIVPEAYQDLLELLDDPKAAEFKEELIGENIIQTAPPEYWFYPIAQKYGKSIGEFEQLDIDEKARMIANSHLVGMSDIIAEYRRRMKQKRKQSMQKAAKA